MLGAFLSVAAIVLFVLAHEAGHFVAAKATGMKVTEFFFGFGPRIWSFKRGETEYGFKVIPFGGYVKIVGMSQLEEVPPEDVGRTYREKEFWKKSVVVLSGVAMNFLIAYVMFFGLNLAQGIPVPTNEVAVVVETLEGGAPSPAVEAGLAPGDVIVAIDGVPTETWEEVASTLAARPGERITLTILRGGQTLEIAATLAERRDPETGAVRGFLGVGPTQVRESIGVTTAAGIAGRQVWASVGFTFQALGNLIRPENLSTLAGGLVGQDVPDEIRPVSPIGIAQLGAQTDQIGVANFIGLLASVNIILGTLNVLPLYPLDGGHFAVALYEKLTGRRADIRKLAPIAAMVIAFVAFLGLVAIVLDIVNPIRL